MVLELRRALARLPSARGSHQAQGHRRDPSLFVPVRARTGRRARSVGSLRPAGCAASQRPAARGRRRRRTRAAGERLRGCHVRYHVGVVSSTRTLETADASPTWTRSSRTPCFCTDPRSACGRSVSPRIHWWPDLPLWWSDDRTLERLAEDGSEPEAVAAEHWVRSVERLLGDARRLPPSRYLEIRYEALPRALRPS